MRRSAIRSCGTPIGTTWCSGTARRPTAWRSSGSCATREVLGVYANADIKHEFFWPHYSLSSTARRANQLEIEDQLSRLSSPAWPTDVESISPVRKARGAALYEKYCSSCHAIATPGQPQDV